MVQHAVDIDQAERSRRKCRIQQVAGLEGDVTPSMQQTMQASPAKAASGEVQGGNRHFGIGNAEGVGCKAAAAGNQDTSVFENRQFTVASRPESVQIEGIGI